MLPLTLWHEVPEDVDVEAVSHHNEAAESMYRRDMIPWVPDEIEKVREKLEDALGTKLEIYGGSHGCRVHTMHGRGTAMPRHNEGQPGDITAVWFIHDLEPDEGGVLVAEVESGHVEVRPERGKIFVFPSNDFHYVTELTTDRARATVPLTMKEIQ